MKYNQIQPQLDRIFENYADQVTALANRVFEEDVIPLCKKRGWEFYAGNGSWWIGPQNGPKFSDVLDEKSRTNDPALAKIEEILNIVPRGLTSNSLGSLMPVYKGETNE